jgi:hypothetical protein
MIPGTSPDGSAQMYVMYVPGTCGAKSLFDEEEPASDKEDTTSDGEELKPMLSDESIS